MPFYFIPAAIYRYFPMKQEFYISHSPNGLTTLFILERQCFTSLHSLPVNKSGESFKNAIDILRESRGILGNKPNGLSSLAGMKKVLFCRLVIHSPPKGEIFAKDAIKKGSVKTEPFTLLFAKTIQHC